MFLFTHDRNCVHDFEFNLIESYDTIEKINNKEDNIYVHIKTYEEKICNENSKKKKFKKKVYLLGLNYNEYIFLRGNFRFRLIKGLIKFNGEILKPSKEYINVRIPVFYPLFKLIALNVNKIKYMDNKFVYNEGASNKYDNKKKFIGDKNISRTINNKKLKTNNLEDLKNEVDINVLTKNREERNNMNCIISSNENEFLCEYADTIIKNYLYGLNLLPDKNVKKKNFYEYMLFSNKEDISLFSSSFMIDSIKSKPHFENYPIIIAFHRKKDFLYYLYNNNTSKKLNISNYRQHNSCYIDTFQFSYILKEFLLYMYNNKNYDLEKVAKKVEEINSNYISCDNNNNDNNMLNSDISNTNNSSSNNNIINKNNDNVENLVQTISGNEKYKVEKSTDNFTKEESHLNKKEYLESFIKNIGKTNISENYYDYEEKCSSSHNIFSVIIMGDKNKGKSFLVINFINNLLNYYKSVILVDVDIGQPIIGTSGFLSIYKIKYSLNNYNFFEKKNKCIKKIFYGCCSLNNNVHFYITCLKNIYNYLFFEYLKKKKKKKNICNYPLVINTFGWIRNIGLFLLHVNIFLSKCDFIIQIDSLKINKNLKGKLRNEEYYSYLFNDFLLINQNEKNRIILNLNNKNISIISKRYSIFNVIRRYNNLNENNFLFYNFYMSFQNNEEKEEIMKELSSNYDSGNILKYGFKTNLNELRKRDNVVAPLNNPNYNRHTSNNYNSHTNNYSDSNTNNNYNSHTNNYSNSNTNNNYNSHTNNYSNSNTNNNYNSHTNNYSNSNTNNNYNSHTNNYSNSNTNNNYNRSSNNYYNSSYIDNGYNNCKMYNSSNNNMDNLCGLNSYIHKMKHLKYSDNVFFSSSNSGDRYNNKSLIQKTNYCKINRNNYDNVNNNTSQNNKDNLIKESENEIRDYEKYEYFKEIIDYFLKKKYIRVINFVSYKKILSYENTERNNFKSKNFYILAKNLRSYRFFCYFFYKFKKLIFYIHSYSLYDRLTDFFIKHKNYMRYLNINNDEAIFNNSMREEKNIINYRKERYFIENKKEESYNKEDIVECDHIDKFNTMDAYNTHLNEKEVSNNNSTRSYDLHIGNIQKDENIEEIQKKSINQPIYETYKIPCNTPLFTCAIFYLKNIKLSNILFNDDNAEIFSNDVFIAYKYFFNNIICLCNDNSKEALNTSGVDKKDKVSYYIDYLEIGKSFENLNYNIEKEYLKKNNVQLVPLSEYFTHILTAYVKAIDSMRLVIYLPYWFDEFHLLDNINTFVSGNFLVPHNLNDMVENYSFYMDLVSCKHSKNIELLKANKPSEDVCLNSSI